MSVCALLLDFREEGPHVLTTTRKDDPSMLCLPGGKLEPGESLTQAAVRELEEETGLSVHENCATPVFTSLGSNGWMCTAFMVTSAYLTRYSVLCPEPGTEVAWTYLSLLVDPGRSPYYTFHQKMFKSMGLWIDVVEEFRSLI